MSTLRSLHFVLAASLALSALAGCTLSPLTTARTSTTLQPPAATNPVPASTTRTGTTTTVKAGPNTAFTSQTATNAVNSATAVTTASTAKALAVNDETLMESASAAMEADESVAAPYALQSNRQGARASQIIELGFLGGERMQGLRQQPLQRPRPQIRQTINVNVTIVNTTVILNQRRTQAKKQQVAFVKANPKYSEEVEAIRKVLDAQPWQPNEDDDTTLLKSGTSSLKLATGASRKVSVLRVVSKKQPHHLVHGVTDLAEVKADGSEKTVHWEKALQEDGSFDITYHHDATNAKGQRWVTDWTKTLRANGTLSGTGTFTSYEADGTMISEEVLTIGGSDETGQVIEEAPVDEPLATNDTPATTEAVVEDEAAPPSDDTTASAETETEVDAEATTDAAVDEEVAATAG